VGLGPTAVVGLERALAHLRAPADHVRRSRCGRRLLDATPARRERQRTTGQRTRLDPSGQAAPTSGGRDRVTVRAWRGHGQTGPEPAAPGTHLARSGGDPKGPNRPVSSRGTGRPDATRRGQPKFCPDRGHGLWTTACEAPPTLLTSRLAGLTSPPDGRTTVAPQRSSPPVPGAPPPDPATITRCTTPSTARAPCVHRLWMTMWTGRGRIRTSRTSRHPQPPRRPHPR
jgi:hypothetical protein